MKLYDRYLGTMFGMACGDAVGSKVEWKTRAWCKLRPVKGMEGSDIHKLEPGQFTDDTSMALCLAASLVECNGFDAKDQIDRYVKWREEGYMGCQGRCIGIGKTVSGSLDDYLYFGNGPLDGNKNPNSAGNGSLMRIAPIPLFYHNYADMNWAALKSSCTTHGSPETNYACVLYSIYISRALNGWSKDEILAGTWLSTVSEHIPPKIVEISNGSYFNKPEADINGTGYVIDSLEAALWCFKTTNSYKEAVLTAANLGDDADTTAAIVGMLAGAYYGVEGIPEEWLDVLDMKDVITNLTDGLYKHAVNTLLI